jgi:hypothetical protein
VELKTTLWWVVLPVLAAVGLHAVRRASWRPHAVLAVGSAIFVAVPYLFLIDYAAPRFLLPTYGLLAIPAAAGLLWLVSLPQRWLRIVATALALLLLIAHFHVQQEVFTSANGLLLRTARQQALEARFLQQRLGIEPPCFIWGPSAVQQAYLLKCGSRWVYVGAPSVGDLDIRAALDRGDKVVVRLRAGTRVPASMSSWRRVALPGTKTYVVYVAPARQSQP